MIELRGGVWPSGLPRIPYERTELIQKTTLPAHTKAVLIVLSGFSNKLNSAWPKVRTIALRTSLSDRAVQRVLNSARKEGWVTAEFKKRGATTYHIMWLKLPMLTDEEIKECDDESEALTRPWVTA